MMMDSDDHTLMKSKSAIGLRKFSDTIYDYNNSIGMEQL